MTQDLQAKVDSIESREDFLRFVRALSDDLDENPEAWENVTLKDHLEVLAELVDSVDDVYADLGRPVPAQPTWKLFGQLLLACKYYE